MSKQPPIEQLDQAITGMLSGPGAVPSSADSSVIELLGVARDLRHLPSPKFKASLKADLERKMVMKTNVILADAPVRPGFHTITPYLVLPHESGYIDFLKNVFGAEETLRHETGPGRAHVELRIGDSMMMVGIGAERRVPAGLTLYVPNVDEVYNRAVAAGCKALQPVEDAHWEPLRLGTVQDPEGNGWSICTYRGASYIPEGRHSLSAGFCVAGAARLVDFMKQAFDATEVQRWEWPGGMFASMQIGDSVVGVADAGNHEFMAPVSVMVLMYVPDADAVYHQALRAGATSLQEPANQSYGRSGGVVDAWGNQWYMATP
jgi:PhnB protein